MALVKVYLDDAGSPNDPAHSCVTVAGYVSTASGWDWFYETHWPQMLATHEVPYLHMKEFRGP